MDPDGVNKGNTHEFNERSKPFAHREGSLRARPGERLYKMPEGPNTGSAVWAKWVRLRDQEPVAVGEWLPNGLQPASNGPQPGDSLQPTSDGLHPSSDGLHPSSNCLLPSTTY